MLRRTLIAAAWGQAGVLMVLPGLAQTGVRRIAYVWLFSSGPSAPYPAEFRNRLRELGWIEGKSVEIVQYDAEGSPEKLAAIMKRLVDEKVDVIVGTCTPEAKAAVKATQTIPIVMAATGDPVGAGLAQSFARPGGNVTGVSGMGLDLSAKRLEILKTSFPNVARATVVFNPERPDNLPEVRAMQAAGLTVGVKVDTLEVRTPTELNDGLDLLPSSTQALLNAGDSLLGSQAPRVIAEAARRRIPALYEDRDYVDRGGLMSYGPSIGRLHRRAADYVDRILKGASPAELPIEQPTSFELVINLKTAKALGLPIPRAVLLRANEIIQ